MAQSNAKTVDAYIQSLPPERAEIIGKIRALLKQNMPQRLTETMRWGMISYEVPLKTYPNTYNKMPLSYAALAAQKHHYAIYLNNMYMSKINTQKVLSAFEAMGVKPNMGKSCIRFTKLDKIPLDTILQVYKNETLERFIASYETARKK